MDHEKASFADRLRAALRSAGIEESAAVLEKRFNSRYRGAPVTAQAVSGWLTGRHVPKQDKIRVLAELVGMDPQVLHYGRSEGVVAEPGRKWPEGVGARERQVIDTFLSLPPRRRELVSELVAALKETSRR